MSFGFSFNFSGDDIEDDDAGSKEDAMEVDKVHANVGRELPELLPVQVHPLADILSTLPSLLSYNRLSIPSLSPSDSPRLPRRAHFDIQTQLQAEAEIEIDPPEPQPTTAESDILPQIYEGGLKTWESSIDLAAYLSRPSTSTPTPTPNPKAPLDPLATASPLEGYDIIELGCGTAIPSLVLLQQHLRACQARTAAATTSSEEAAEPAAPTRPNASETRFFLCDYNRSVLEAATGANVLLTLLDVGVVPPSPDASLNLDADPNPTTSDPPSPLHLPINPNGEGDISTPHSPTLAAIPHLLSRPLYRTTLTFLSGAWGPPLVEAIYPPAAPTDPARLDRDVLILTSETIYAPAQLEALVYTILGLLRRGGGGKGRGRGRALVAAKRLYFGVGGGVDGFRACVEREGGKVRGVWESGNGDEGGAGGGVGRVVLEVRLGEGKGDEGC